MEVFDWLFLIKNKVVYVIGSIKLTDIWHAILGFLEAMRVVKGTYTDPIYPGFQLFVESKLGLKRRTAKGRALLITEHTANEEAALRMFYELLHEYLHVDLE